MIHDRGNIKWQGFILPEHRELLQHLYEVEQHMIEKPILDEQKWEELNETLLLAMEDKKPLYITYFEEGFIKKFYGYITRTDYLTQSIYFRNLEKEDTRKIAFANLVNLEIDYTGKLPVED
jgi:hypothetical protein